MRIGVIAPEAPPEHGGMQSHLDGLLRHIPSHLHVELFTRKGLGTPRATVTVHDTLTGGLEADLDAVRGAHVDAWLGLNGGVASFFPKLAQPCFSYMHGNDCVAPWYPTPAKWERLARIEARVGLAEAISPLSCWRRRAIAKGLRKARGIFANSAFTASAVARATGVASANITVVNPGIDEGHCRIVERRRGLALALLTVTRLTRHSRRKNVDGVLEAMAQLKTEMEISYVVIGGGDDLERLRRKAQRLGLGGDVQFRGFLESADLRRAYDTADLFILPVKPSNRDVEGFGMAYVEAAGCGLPSLAVDNGGVAEAVKDGATGILIKDGSAKSIIEGIQRFAASSAGFRQSDIEAFARARSAPVTSNRLWNSLLSAL